MNKIITLCGVAFLGLNISISAQTKEENTADNSVILTVGTEVVSLADFKYIYSKNNRDSVITSRALDEYMELFVKFKLKVMEAEALGMDTVAKFTKELAGYRKQLKKQIEPDPEKDPAKNRKYLNIGEGYAQGAEFLLQHRQGDKFFGWLSYARSVSKRRDAPDQAYRFYSYDQTHIATVTASYKFTKTFEIGGRWQYATGNPYTPLTCEENIDNPCYQRTLDPRNRQARKIPLYGAINSFRVTPFHRLDVRISKTFVFDTWQMGTYLELINAYNRKNVLQFNYDENYARDEDGEVKKEIIGQLPLVPYVGIILEF